MNGGRKRKADAWTAVAVKRAAAQPPHRILAQDWFARRLVRVSGSLRTLQSIAAANKPLGLNIDTALENVLRLDLPKRWQEKPQVLVVTRALRLTSSQRNLVHLGGLDIPELMQLPELSTRGLVSLHVAPKRLPGGTMGANSDLLPALLSRHAQSLRHLVVVKSLRSGYDTYQPCFKIPTRGNEPIPQPTNITTLHLRISNDRDSEHIMRSVHCDALKSLSLNSSALLLGFLGSIQFSALTRLQIPLVLLPVAAKAPNLQSLRIHVGFQRNEPYNLSVLCGCLRHLCLDLTGFFDSLPDFRLGGLRLEVLELRLPEHVNGYTRALGEGALGAWTTALVASQPALPRLSVRCCADMAGAVGLGELNFGGALRLVLHFDGVTHNDDRRQPHFKLPTHLCRLHLQMAPQRWELKVKDVAVPDHSGLEELHVSADLVSSWLTLGRFKALKAWSLGLKSGMGPRSLHQYCDSL